MKKVLVLGISGTFGKHVARALKARGWAIKAMLRDERKLPDEFSGIETVQGDASRYSDVKQAADGVSMLVYGISPDNYDWEDKALPWLDVSARVAEEFSLTIIYPGNIYNYNPDEVSLIDETSPQHPICRKGEIRQHMELRLEKAAKHGAKVILLRMGNFIATPPLQSWLPMIIKAKKNQYVLQSPDDKHVKHAWAYMPDAAEVVAMLVEKSHELEAYSTFQFKGYEISMVELAQTIKETSGKPVVIKAFPWWFLHILRPFLVAIRGAFEMRYLWQHELLLNDVKLRSTLGNIPQTPLAKALVDSGYIKAK